MTITTRTSGLRSSAAQWASSASSIGTVSALSFAGLSSRSSATAPVDGQVQRAHDAALTGSPAAAPCDAATGAGFGSSTQAHRTGAEQARRQDPRVRREAHAAERGLDDVALRVDPRHDLGRDQPLVGQPDHAALGDVEHLLPELAAPAGRRRSRARPSRPSSGTCRASRPGSRPSASSSCAPASNCPAKTIFLAFARDVDEAAAAGGQVRLLAELGDVDVALEVDLEERQEGHVEAAALEVGELARRSA